MTDADQPAASFGQSYGDIVVAKFRKNTAAVVAVWVIGILVLLAIFAPLISNNRPYAFYGTVPAAYATAFRELTGPAHGTLRFSPERFRRDLDLLNNEAEGTLMLMMEFLPAADKDDLDEWILNFDETDKRVTLAERMGRNDPMRGALKSYQITLSEFRSLELNEKELGIFEKALASARARVRPVYERRVELSRAGVQEKLNALLSQLPAEREADAEALALRYESLIAGNYLDRGADAGEFRELRVAVREAFDPERAQLVPRWRLPLFQSLDALDALFITAALAWMLVFGPLQWLKLKRIRPRGRRWLIQWALVLGPALCMAAGWIVFHRTTLDRADYKAWPRDGKMVVEREFWPPHRYHQDEHIEGIARKEAPPRLSNPLGLDHIGRDLLARILWGARISLSVGFVSTTIALTIGIIVGSIAGYFGGIVDWILLRVVEVFMCFPYFFVVLAVAAFLPSSENRIYFIMLALGLFQWMVIARLTRGEFLRLRKQDFVTAARAMGARGRRIIFRHVLPNALAPVLITASFGIAGAILAESALSFLGFGVEEPDVSWGKLLNAARTQPKTWWPLAFPGLCIFLSITCYNMIGDAVRDAVDPRLKVE